MTIQTNSNHAKKRITSGSRVSSKHGKLIANPNPNVWRRVKELTYGIVLRAADINKYVVKFDDGRELICTSCSLKVERASRGVPVLELNPGKGQLLNTVEDGVIADGE